MGKSSPAPVDYKGAALAEGEKAREITEAQTWANRPNQVNPWGEVSWQNTPTWDPTTNQNINQWTQTQTMSPALNQALQSQMGLMAGRSDLGYGMMNNISQELGTPMDWSQFGGPQNIGEQSQMHQENLPQLWGHLQYDLPQYQTSGTLRDLNFANAPDVTAPQFGVDRAENAIYDRQQSRLDPQWQGKRQQAEIKLRNQGLSPGDQAYDSAMQNLGMQENDAYNAAQLEAIKGGGREAERMFGMESGYRDQYTGEVQRAGEFMNQAGQQEFGQNMMAGSQGFQDARQAAEMQNRAREQMFNERMGMVGYNQNLDFRRADYYNKLRESMINEQIARRGQSLNEANALIAGQQVGLPQFSGFSQAGAAQAPQLLAAANMQGQQNAANASADNSAFGGLMSGLGSVAGIAGMFSDRRLKSNIRKIGERNGVNWYEYDIFGGRQIGVMADEVPWASFEHPSGYLMVDYSRV